MEELRTCSQTFYRSSRNYSKNNTSRRNILLQKVYLDKSLILINSMIYQLLSSIKRNHRAMDSKLSAYNSRLRTCSSIMHFHTPKDKCSHNCSNRMMLFYKSALSSSSMDTHNCSCNMCNLSPCNTWNKIFTWGMYNYTSPSNSINQKTYNTLTARRLARKGNSSLQKNSHTRYLYNTSHWSTLIFCLAKEVLGIHSSENHTILD